ncbi:MAG: hypothetical protein HY290_31605 [Planctomycetia bacterium]|nr:hypothetical protein [Planctomycetia bacterium]
MMSERRSFLERMLDRLFSPPGEQLQPHLVRKQLILRQASQGVFARSQALPGIALSCRLCLR